MRSRMMCSAAACMVLSVSGFAVARENLHFTYLWHLEQPIYWPDQKVGSPDRYEYAWESILRKDAGAANPANNLREIFGLDDRKNASLFGSSV